jgi:FAD/FMN-containing dehydrogenase
VWLRPEQKTVRVQAGMTWRDLQDHLDPHGLAVRVMQSYANFTVGGSVSVNAHGRYVGLGPVGNTVRALQLVLADGTVVEATRQSHGALFRAAIGGYGGIGVITEVELDVADNVRIERSVRRMPLDDYVAYFRSEVLPDTGAVLHNADLHPPAFREPVCTSWRRAGEKPLTVTDRLVARGQAYGTEQNLLWAISELPAGHALRSAVVQPRLETQEVKWLNHEASMDVAQLEPRTRAMSSYVLQEYFVPPASLVPFVRAMAAILQVHRANVLNVSIRHSPADAVSVLPWARTESFSLVLYYKQRSSASATRAVGQWTRALIDLALAHGGRYYLPYQPHATRAQFEAAYPEVAEFRRIKSGADPSGKLSNELWRKYL